MPESKEGADGYSKHMKGVAVAILVMGVSLAAIIIIYVSFGHYGPTFSTSVMEKQQDTLTKQYGLPARQPISKEMLEVPPSLRNATLVGNST
jgi:hypothetical protein